MDQVKEFYGAHRDDIRDKRVSSPFPTRRYAHLAQYEAVAQHVKPGATVLDAGCGDGALSFLLAKKGCHVTGLDLSEPNIEAAKQEAQERGLDMTFLVGDAEQLPFGDQSFDVVVSSHVLEHLPNFQKGWNELCRVARDEVVVALPTPLNFCALALLGGDRYWQFSKRSLVAIPLGLLRLVLNVFRDGVQEGYAGKGELPHVWRYPWIIYRRLRNPGWKLVSFEASSFCFPYCSKLVGLSKAMKALRKAPILKYFGFGSTMVFNRKEKERT